MILLPTFLIIIPLINFQGKVLALDSYSGEHLFIKHCSGCHINGGNIIRRNKTLKLNDLKRNGLDNPEAIAKIANNGVGSMNGYKEFLGENGDIKVANWIWEQSQKAWIHG
nr:c-type cytochrome [Prochlorococcus marinus]